jgi:hypothetical protein
VLAQRRQNRGFEAIALDNGRLYAFVQSPLRNPVSAANGALNGNRNIRLVEFNPTNNTTREFIYVMDNPNLGAEIIPAPTRSVTRNRSATASSSWSSATTTKSRATPSPPSRRRCISSTSLA